MDDNINIKMDPQGIFLDCGQNSFGWGKSSVGATVVSWGKRLLSPGTALHPMKHIVEATVVSWDSAPSHEAH
jgi:hypothetical protein